MAAKSHLRVILYVSPFSFYFSLLKNRLKRACEGHQAKRRRMEIYYNVPQGDKVTDKQRHSYHDNDERIEDALLNAVLLHRLLNSNNEEEDEDDDDYGPPPF